MTTASWQSQFPVHAQTGFPILNPATSAQLYEQLEMLGVRKQRIVSSRPLSELKPETLTNAQRDQLRFAPQNEVLSLEGNEDLWFRTRAKDWACTFTLLPGDLVVLIAEYKHGADTVTVVPPAGVPRKGESMADCAKREYEEETGIALAKVVPLCGPGGLALSGRKSTEHVFPFVGYPRIKARWDEGFDHSGPTYQLICAPQRLDAKEKLTAFLMPLRAYWNFIGNAYDNEAGVRDAAYAALRELGFLSLRV